MDFALKQTVLKRETLVLLLCLVLGFFASLLLNPEWIYNYVGWVDGWAYFGGLYNPIHMRTVYPAHPLGDLLPLVLPGGLYYAVLPPYFANLLFKVTCFVLSGFFMFKIVKAEFGTRTAVWGTIAFLASKDFLSSTGEDYTEGRVIVYYLMALFFTLKAVDLESRQEKIYLGLAGLSFCLCVSTAFLSITYGAVIALLYIGKRWRKHGRLNADFIVNGLCFAAGFAFAVLALCAIHYSYTGRFIYFQSTLTKVSSYLGMERGRPEIVFGADWLAISLYTFAAAPLLFLNRNYSQKFSALLMTGGSLISLGVLSYLQVFKHQGTVSDPFYFNQTVPITFLAMSGVLLAPWLDNLSRRMFGWGTAIFIILTYALFWFTTSHYPHPVYFAHFNLFNWAIFTACMLALTFVNRSAISVALIAFFLFAWNFCPTTNSLVHKNFAVTGRIPSRQIALQVAVDWIRLMDKLDPRREAYLWYDRSGEGSYLAGLSGASHYWQGRIYNEAFPAVNTVIGEGGVMAPGRLAQQPLIIMTENPVLLPPALARLKSLGITAYCEKADDFISGGKRYFGVYRCNCKTGV